MDINAEFVPGLELNERFYHQIVREIIASQFPTLDYSAALIGPGSDVLGFDTPRSRDHDWGLRLQLFLSGPDYQAVGAELDRCLRRSLPKEFMGYPVGWSEPDLADGGTRQMEFNGGDEVNHNIRITTIEAYVQSHLGIKPEEDIDIAHWLSWPEQKLLEFTSGKVFHDGVGQLVSLRERLAYYPQDVWLYRMAAQWMRLSQEEPFMGRCGELNDELGSRLIASRLIWDMMRLCFLMERRYAPYSKWLGTAFSTLECGPRLTKNFLKILEAHSWQEREEYLIASYQSLVDMFNELGITPRIEADIKCFFDRPYRVLYAHRFSEALLEQISDQRLQGKGFIGAVDRFVDATDVTTDILLCRSIGEIIFR